MEELELPIAIPTPSATPLPIQSEEELFFREVAHGEFSQRITICPITVSFENEGDNDFSEDVKAWNDILDQELIEVVPAGMGKIKVTFTYQTVTGRSGEAGLFADNKCLINVKPNIYPKTILHEIGHCIGFHHFIADSNVEEMFQEAKLYFAFVCEN
jgi:hypothetical protein